MIGHELLVGSGDQSCESCEQRVGLQDDVCGSIAPGFLQGIEHIAVLGACHPRMTNRWASCVTQELLQALAVTVPDTDLGVQRESIHAGAQRLRRAGWLVVGSSASRSRVEGAA